MTLLLLGAALAAAPPNEVAEYSLGGVPGPAHNPGRAEQTRLVVEWGKPKVEKEKGGSRLLIPGKLLLKSADGRRREAVAWVQPISIVLGRSHRDRPNWAEGFSTEDSVWDDTFVNWAQDTKDPRADGTFRATFPVRTLRRPIATTKSFQLGLALGRRAGDRAYWTNRTPVLPQSVAIVNIPGPPALSPTLRLINGTPSPIGWQYDPVAVLKAVNHLRALGKARAIRALREFLALAEDPGYGGLEPVDAENIDTSNQWCLALLVPLVFESNAPKDTSPFGLPDGVTVWEGIPFHTVVIGGTSGWPPSTAPLVDWAEKHGRAIKGQLRPADNPLQAADDLLAKRGNTAKGPRQRGGLVGHVRQQAWQMIARLVEPDRKQRRTQWDELFRSDTQWSKLKERVRRLKIRWDEKKQAYVAG